MENSNHTPHSNHQENHEQKNHSSNHNSENSKPVQNRKKNRLVKILAGVLVVLILVVGVSAFAVRSTPRYAFCQMQQAIQNKDFAEFEEYADLDAIVDGAIEYSKSQSEETDAETAGEFAGFQDSLIAIFKPILREEFKKNVESGELINSEKSLADCLSSVDVKVENGDLARIKTISKDSDVEIVMTKKSSGWKWTGFTDYSSLDFGAPDSEFNQQESNSRESEDVQQGNTLTMKDVTIKIEEVSIVQSLAEPNSFGENTLILEDKPESSYLILKLSGENKGKTAFNTFSLRVQDGEGTEYSEQEFLPVTDNINTLLPGIPTSGRIAYEVKNNFQFAKLAYDFFDEEDNYKLTEYILEYQP